MSDDELVDYLLRQKDTLFILPVYRRPKYPIEKMRKPHLLLVFQLLPDDLPPE